MLPGRTPIQPLEARSPLVGVRLMTTNDSAMSVPVMLLWSVVAHGALALAILITLFVLSLLGVTIPLFQPLAMPQKTMEFVLVQNPEAPPRDKNTKNRAERASRSGGVKVPNRPQAEPQRSAGQPTRAARPQAAQQPRPVQRPTPAQPTQARQPQPRQAVTPRPSTTSAPPAPKLPTPTAKNAAPALPPSPTAPAIKFPSTPAAPRAIATGPVVTTPGSGGSRSGSSGTPGPAQIPGTLGGGGGASGAAGSRSGSGGRGSYDQSGSPGGGGGRAGIDAMPEPDFGPYIAELQRRIKRNWAPPSDDKNKRIVALFTIARDGRLTSIRIQSSSGVKVADDAALAAVRASAPFRPLPPNFRGNDIDVQFIFDYNVYTGRSNGITYSQ